jgi:ABC-2 type transport system permease protein
MFWRIFTLVIKELETLLQDRQSGFILIVPVFLQLAVFPFAATLEVKNNTLAVYNEDNGRESTELMQRFSQGKAFTQLLNLHSEAEVRRTIDNQQALLVLRFPPDFSRDFASASPKRFRPSSTGGAPTVARSPSAMCNRSSSTTRPSGLRCSKR